MALAKDYDSVMARSGDINLKALGIDYKEFESGSVAFDYEGLMAKTGYTVEEVAKIQARTAVGNTPLLELRNLTALARKYAEPGKGARIFAKDEAANASGSFKARRAGLRCCPRRKIGDYNGGYGCYLRQLRRRSSVAGCHAGAEVHRGTGVLRLQRRRSAGDRRKGQKVRGLRRGSRTAYRRT